MTTPVPVWAATRRIAPRLLLAAMLSTPLVSGMATAPAAADARPGAAASAQAATLRYDHRVVVATTSRDFESDVDASLERNVNALAALGYELTALVGGDGAALDRLLVRQPYKAGLVDHAGHTFALMARPEGVAVPARAYRIVHVRADVATGVDDAVAGVGADGFRLALSAHEAAIVHVAFERVAGAAPVEHRVFRNRGRRSWMDQALADPETRARLTRVLPLALDTGLVELGPPQATPGDMQWLSKPTHDFEALEAPLRDLAATGYRVQLLRARLNTLDVLVVKPAGATASTADYDLEDGPWGMACGRGAIAGAAVMPDGDVACITDRRAASATPAGLDLTISRQALADGRLLFRGPDCDIRARMTSTRGAPPRVALAVQFEREVARAAAAGTRVVAAMAAVDTRGQMRIVALTTDAPPDVRAGAAAPDGPAPPLVPEHDGVGLGLVRQREIALNAALARETRFGGHPLWIELESAGSRREARLLGCVPVRADREIAASAARSLLSAEGLADYRLDNRLIAER